MSHNIDHLGLLFTNISNVLPSKSKQYPAEIQASLESLNHTPKIARMSKVLEQLNAIAAFKKEILKKLGTQVDIHKANLKLYQSPSLTKQIRSGQALSETAQAIQAESNRIQEEIKMLEARMELMEQAADVVPASYLAELDKLYQANSSDINKDSVADQAVTMHVDQLSFPAYFKGLKSAVQKLAEDMAAYKEANEKYEQTLLDKTKNAALEQIKAIMSIVSNSKENTEFLQKEMIKSVQRAVYALYCHVLAMDTERLAGQVKKGELQLDELVSAIGLHVDAVKSHYNTLVSTNAIAKKCENFSVGSNALEVLGLDFEQAFKGLKDIELSLVQPDGQPMASSAEVRTKLKALDKVIPAYSIEQITALDISQGVLKLLNNHAYWNQQVKMGKAPTGVKQMVEALAKTKPGTDPKEILSTLRHIAVRRLNQKVFLGLFNQPRSTETAAFYKFLSKLDVNKLGPKETGALEEIRAAAASVKQPQLSAKNGASK